MTLWNETTALFGGTFDPPHLGHREAVQGLFRIPGVRRVLVMPSAIPPHKPCFTPTEHRIRMLELNFSKISNVSIDLREIQRAQEWESTGSQATTYTFHTLTQIQREIPNLAFVMGTDQLRDMRAWYRFPEVLTLAHWLVLARKPDGAEIAQKTLQEWGASGLARMDSTLDLSGNCWRILWGNSERLLRVIPTEAPAISSTAIRESISRTGEPPANCLHPDVAAYLNEYRLYGTGCDTHERKLNTKKELRKPTHDR